MRLAAGAFGSLLLACTAFYYAYRPVSRLLSERAKVLEAMTTLAEEKTFLPYQYFLLFSPGR